ncbi:MAG: TspO/MBR family protein [Patescibacteria group bacterium]
MRRENLKHLLYNLLKVSTVSLIGGMVTTPAIKSWYASINKPTFNPPSWVFSPVWTALFLMMAVSAYMINMKAQNKELLSKAISAYNLQLFLNLLWSILFFGLKSPTAALVEIAILWCAILYTILRFKEIYKLSAVLLVPYLLWVTFATVLNFYIFLLN